jgi:peroxiredoxin
MRLTFLLSALFTLASMGDSPISLGKIEKPTIVDLSGKNISLLDAKGTKAAVVFFLGTECPVSNGYSPELIRIVKDYSKKGIAFAGVYPDADLSIEAASKHAKDFALNFPIGLDAKMELAKKAGAKTVLSCCVIAADGTIVYRGRIDDRYTETGKRREVATTFELKETLEAIAADNVITPRETKAFGCPIDFPK